MPVPILGRPYYQKVLPLVYDDALSYLEVVEKLRYKVNEVIELFNNYEQTIEDLSEYVQDIQTMKADISALKSGLSAAETSLSSLIAKHDNDVEALRTVDANLQKQIDELVVKVNSIVTSYDSIIDYVDNKVATVTVENSTAWIRLENYINTQNRLLQLQINELADKINHININDVYNPVRGYRESLDDNNWDVYQDLRYGGFTNADLAEFGVSNETVASLVHDNRDYALHAKERFKLHYLFSPVTGRKVSHANAISQAIIAVVGAITNNSMMTTTNTMLYNYMNTNNLTNDDISTLYSDNFKRYTVSV